MLQFGTIKKLDLRDVWKNEAHHFTPWLSDNMSALGESLGMELVLEAKEASVGDFSLDLLAKDLGSGGVVIIENQLTQTDHDHLGKLITYAAGYNASVVVWVSESIREEHRQALEWLNQRTDSKTQFFGVVVEVIQIDDSKPAYNFKPIIFPNEWQKNKRRQVLGQTSSREEAYRNFFQSLIDDLRETYKFTGAKTGQPQSWYSFSSGYNGVYYGPSFAQNKRVRVEAYIDLGDTVKNKDLFDALFERKIAIEEEFQCSLEWEALENKRASRIAVYKAGSIMAQPDELREIHSWMIENLLKFKKIFNPHLKQILKASNHH